jgi:aryl-alcohol dehydrogenase-like predicted oxidoreductase
MEPDELPRHLSGARDHLRAYRQALVAYDITPVRAALQFALSRPEVDTAVVGVCTMGELTELCKAARRPVCAEFDYRRWGIDDKEILNPSCWQTEESLI